MLANRTSRPRRPASSEPGGQRTRGGRGKGRGRSAADKVAAARDRHPEATQRDVARRTGLSVRSVARYWRGSTPAEVPEPSPDGRGSEGVPELVEVTP